MTRGWVIRVLAVCAVLATTISAATADDGGNQLFARLSGFNEVPPVLTDGTATFSATVNGDSLTYRLTFSGLSAPPTMSHLHFAERGVNGGIFLWLCGSATNPGPAGTPTCPAEGVPVTRTVTAADIQAVPPQHVAAGDFQGALRIIRHGDAYANIHTATAPGGEIRGQVIVGDGD